MFRIEFDKEFPSFIPSLYLSILLLASSFEARASVCEWVAPNRHQDTPCVPHRISIRLYSRQSRCARARVCIIATHEEESFEKTKVEVLIAGFVSKDNEHMCALRHFEEDSDNRSRQTGSSDRLIFEVKCWKEAFSFSSSRTYAIYCARVRASHRAWCNCWKVTISSDVAYPQRGRGETGGIGGLRRPLCFSRVIFRVPQSRLFN